MAIMTVHKVTQLPDPLAANAFYILQIAINGEPDHLQFVVTDSNGVPYSTTDNTDLAEMIADIIGAQFLVDSVTINNTDTNPVLIGSVQLGEVQENPTQFTLADRLKAVATILQNRLPSTLGAKTGINSLPVVLSSDDVLTGNIGAKADPVADDDTGTFSLIALVKRVSSRLTTLIGRLPTSLTAGGALKVGVTETTGLTDTQLRATAVPVSGPLTDTQLRATSVPVSGPLTDTQLRATAVPMSANQLPATLGAKTAANSLSITLSTDDSIVTGFGSKSDSVAADDTGTYSHIALLKRIASRLSSLIALLPNAFTSGGGVKVGLVDAIPAGIASIGAVTSNSVVSSVSFARPGDILSYTGGDTISNSTSSPTVLTFTNMARQNGGTGTLVRARLMTDLKTFAARCRLHIFHTAPTAVADNVEYGLLWVDASKRVGYIDFPAFGTEGATNSTAASTMRPSGDGVYSSPDLWYKTAANDTNLYGILTTLDGVAVANAQNFFVELGADRLS